MNLTGDTNTPAMPMTEAQVNHLRRLLAWMRCEWMLDENMQAGMLDAIGMLHAHGNITPEQASGAIQERAAKINRCPAYVRQAVKMLTKALRDHERASGIVESKAVEPQTGQGYEVLTVSAGSPKPPDWAIEKGA